MIKDVFKFKKNCWHVRMMKFIWGYDHRDFNYMCNYFWLSVLNVFIFPFVTLIKGLGMFFGLLYAGIESSKSLVDKACDSKAAKWASEKLDKIFIDDSVLFTVIENQGGSDKKSLKYNKLWKSLDESQRDQLLDKYWARQEALKEAKRKVEAEKRELQAEKERKLVAKIEAAREAEKKRKERINKAAMTFKKIFKVIIWPILAGVAFFVLWGLYAFGDFMINDVYWGWFPWLITWIGIVLGFIAGCIMFIWPITMFGAWIQCKLKGACLPCERRKAILKKIFAWTKYLKYLGVIFIPLVWLGRDIIWVGMVGFGKGCVFVWHMFLSWKEENCPPIEWED